MRTQFVILGLWIILNLLLLFDFSSSTEDFYRSYDDPATQTSLCNGNVHQEEFMEDGASNLSGLDVCRLLQEVSNEIFRILPDHHMNNSHTDVGQLGPFVLGDEVAYVHKSYNNVGLVMQNITCREEHSYHKTSDAKVSAVFRVISIASDVLTASSRTNLSGVTLPAEGTWDSSTGKLCMNGSVPKGMEAQILLYFTRALSIRQRSIIFGAISSSLQLKDSFFPLHFDVIHSPYYLELRYRWYAGSNLSYNYSKIKQADEFRRKSQSFHIMRIPEKFALRYPAIKQDGGVFSLSQIYELTRELYVDAKIATGRVNRARMSIKLEVVSIGPYLARYDFLYKVRHQGILADAKTLLNNNDLLNVSLHLTLSEDPLRSASRSQGSVTYMFLGLYNPQTGMMYLIGCGKVDTTKIDTERGLDCLIEVKVQYAPKNTRWLRDPTVQFSITSQRDKDDALYFRLIRFQSHTIMHRTLEEHEEDVAFRQIFEGALRIVVLAVVISYYGVKGFTWAEI